MDGKTQEKLQAHYAEAQAKMTVAKQKLKDEEWRSAANAMSAAMDQLSAAIKLCDNEWLSEKFAKDQGKLPL